MLLRLFPVFSLEICESNFILASLNILFGIVVRISYNIALSGNVGSLLLWLLRRSGCFRQYSMHLSDICVLRAIQRTLPQSFPGNVAHMMYPIFYAGILLKYIAILRANFMFAPLNKVFGNIVWVSYKIALVGNVAQCMFPAMLDSRLILHSRRLLSMKEEVLVSICSRQCSLDDVSNLFVMNSAILYEKFWRKLGVTKVTMKSSNWIREHCRLIAFIKGLNQHCWWIA